MQINLASDVSAAKLKGEYLSFYFDNRVPIVSWRRHNGEETGDDEN